MTASQATATMLATNPFRTRPFWVAVLINAVWINASEIFRYFALVMPMTRDDMAMVPDVAPMSLGVFMIWGVFDTIWLLAMTGFAWLWLERFGTSARQAVTAGTLAWAAVFGCLWIGFVNMNLGSARVAAVALPLAWLEAVVAALIVRWRMRVAGERLSARGAP